MRNAVLEFSKFWVFISPMKRFLLIEKKGLFFRVIPSGTVLFRAGFKDQETLGIPLWFASYEEDCFSYIKENPDKKGWRSITKEKLVCLDIIENIDYFIERAPPPIKKILEENYKNRISEPREDNMAVNWVVKHCKKIKHPIDAVYYGGKNAAGLPQHHEELFLRNPPNFVEDTVELKIKFPPRIQMKKRKRVLLTRGGEIAKCLLKKLKNI